MSIKNRLIVVGLCALMAGCSTTRSESTALAVQNKTDKMTDMGVRYLLGRGVKQSNIKAFYMFKQAADNDDAFAENEVGYLYASGKGTIQNPELAFKYYMKAADHGLTSAQYNVGLLYMTGFGVKKDKKHAMKWFKKSAEGEFMPAKKALKKYA